MKLKAFTVEPVRKVKLSAGQVEKAFHIDYHAYTFVFKLLVHWAEFVIKIELVTQARAAATGYRSAQAVAGIKLRVVNQVLNFIFSFIRNSYHRASWLVLVESSRRWA